MKSKKRRKQKRARKERSRSKLDACIEYKRKCTVII
jgi:hypothetical protein